MHLKPGQRATLLLAATQLVSALMVVALVRILAHRIPGEGFGLFMTCRQVLSVALPVVVLGLDTGLAHWVAFDPRQRRSYLLLSLLGVGATAAVSALLAAWAAPALGSLLFGAARHAEVAAALGLFLAAMAIQLVSLTYFRGRENLKLVPLLWLGQTALPLLLAAALAWEPPQGLALARFLRLAAGLILALGLVPLLAQLRVERPAPGGAWRLYRFGLGRLPAGLLLAATLSLPVLLASNRGLLALAGEVGAAIIMLRLLEALTTPLTFFLLPQTSRQLGLGDRKTVAHHARGMGLAGLAFVVLMALTGPAMGRDLVGLWLGGGHEGAATAASVLLGTSGFYLGYLLIRPILNALTERPWVTHVTAAGLALAVVALATLGHDTSGALALATAAALVVMGAGSLGLTWALLGLRPGRVELRLAAWAALAGAICLGLDGLTAQAEGLAPLALRLGIRLAAFAAIGYGMLREWRRLARPV